MPSPPSNSNAATPLDAALRKTFLTTPYAFDFIERLMLETALERCDGNITQAANDLGCSRSSIYRMRTKYGL